MYNWLQIAVGCFGIAASFFWCLAATMNPKPVEPGAGFHDVPTGPNTQFAQAWRAATRFNQIAAALTGISVLLLSAAAFLPHEEADPAHGSSP
jgi:hypothetical protein